MINREQHRGIIPDLDVKDLSELVVLVEKMRSIEGVSAYIVGPGLIDRYELRVVISKIKQYSTLPVIYDPRSIDNDGPELAAGFARTASEAGAHAVILPPFLDLLTEANWITACHSEQLTVLVCGHMKRENVVSDITPENIYGLAADYGVTDFVVTGDEPDLLSADRKFLERKLGSGNFALYARHLVSPMGFITGGGITAGPDWHAIVRVSFGHDKAIKGIQSASARLEY